MRHIRPVIRTRLSLSLALGVLSGITLLTLSGGTTWADDCVDSSCDTSVSATPDTSTTPPPADSSSGTPATTPDPTSTAAGPSGGTTDTTSNTGATAQNTTDTAAQSGDAAVVHNGNAGNATSGNSTVDVTQSNLIQTSGSGLNAPATFSVDLGKAGTDSSGNYIIDLSSLLPPGSGNGALPDAALSSTTTDASIANTITATAASGNAIVAGNGNAGNATSGNATIIINLINAINSSVAAGQSFIGTINIYGNFMGNILIPQSVIDQLLATNSGAGSDPNYVSSSTQESITNNVNATATTGDAVVAHNSGDYGSAATGNATTNVTILNLTGRSIVGQNVLLVFVNVLGNWLGLLMDAPAGATSAEYAGGVSTATPSTGYSAIQDDTNLSITNNVNATATTGDAVVAWNQNAGNAKSGDANVAVNILNIEDSVLSLANWFGILFINVLGNWSGSFGIYTPPVAAAPTEPTGDGIAATAFAAVHTHSHHFTTFVSGAATGGTTTSSILGTTTVKPVITPQNLASTAKTQNNHAGYVMPLIGLGMALLILVAAEREKLLRRK